VSVGGLTAWRIGSFAATFAGLFSVLTVIRHTRAEEEAGRADLIRSAATGRDALLASAVVVTLSANVVIGAVAAAGLVAVGQPARGAIAFGVSIGMTGWVFAGVAALAAQVSEGARTARGVGLALVGASFLARVIANASDALAGAVWATPVGWAQRLRPFAGEVWWVAALAVAVAGALLASAWRVAAVRDVGAGLVPTRRGPSSASPFFRTPFALAWRLQRGMWLAWAATFASFGLLVGGVTPGLADLVRDSDELRDMFERLGGPGLITDSFLAGVAGMYGLAAAAYAVQATLRLRDEEENLRAELVLATAVSRARWIGSHVAIAALGPAALLVVVGLATGVTYGLGAGDLTGELPRVLGAALVQLPGVWVFAGGALALFGWAPRWSELSWTAVGAAFILTFVGTILQLSQWILDLSPFTHLPTLPAGSFSATPLIWLSLVAAALGVAGWTGGLRRDIA
jgi:ABC-2 type transport system permease protein